MPLLPTKAASEFSWDAFPPPPPEAENWVPDPDSIAKPNNLPDPRFNRDPYEARRKEAFKKEFKTYNIPSDVAERLKSGSPSPAVQVAAPTHRDFEVSPTLLPSTSISTRNVIMGENTQPATSAISLISRTTVLPERETVPAWAAPLERLLAEDAAKPSTQPTKPLEASILPNLGDVGRAAISAARFSLDPVAKSFEPSVSPYGEEKGLESPNAAAEDVVDAEDILRDEELAWKLATTDLNVDSPKEGLRLQERLLNEFNTDLPRPPTPSTPLSQTTGLECRRGNHGHWLKTRMVMIMEEDLDLSKRITKRELMALSDDEINRYLQKVASAHEQWWEAEQRLRFDGTNGTK